jgi:tetratricopeptide (TPR) repeat protein
VWWAALAVGLMWLRGSAGLLADSAGEFAVRYPFNTAWRTAHTWLLCEAGRYDDARSAVEQYRLDPVALLTEPWPFTATMQMAVASWHLRDEALARRSIEALTPYRDCWGHYLLFVLAPVTWGLAAAYAGLGEYDRAVELMTETVDRVRQKGGRAHEAVFGADLAKVLLQRNAPGDRERAMAVLAEARLVAEEVGAPGVVERIDATART